MKFKKILLLFSPLIVASAAFPLLTSCSNADKAISISTEYENPTLSARGDGIIMTANVANGYAHAISWNVNAITNVFGKDNVTVTIITKNIFNDTCRVEIQKGYSYKASTVKVYATNGESTGNCSIRLSPTSEYYEEFSIDQSFAPEYYFEHLQNVTHEELLPTELKNQDCVSWSNWLMDKYLASGRYQTEHIWTYLEFGMNYLLTGLAQQRFSRSPDGTLTGSVTLSQADDGSGTWLFSYNVDIPSSSKKAVHSTNLTAARNDPTASHGCNMIFMPPLLTDSSFLAGSLTDKTSCAFLASLLPYYSNCDYTKRSVEKVSSNWQSSGDEVIGISPRASIPVTQEYTPYKDFFYGAKDDLPTATQINVHDQTNLNLADKDDMYMRNIDSPFIDGASELANLTAVSTLSTLKIRELKINHETEALNYYFDLSTRFSSNYLFGTAKNVQTVIDLVDIQQWSTHDDLRFKTRPWIFFSSIYVDRVYDNDGHMTMFVSYDLSRESNFTLAEAIDQSYPSNSPYGEPSTGTFMRGFQWTGDLA